MFVGVGVHVHVHGVCLHELYPKARAQNDTVAKHAATVTSREAEAATALAKEHQELQKLAKEADAAASEEKRLEEQVLQYCTRVVLEYCRCN